MWERFQIWSVCDSLEQTRQWSLPKKERFCEDKDKQKQQLRLSEMQSTSSPKVQKISPFLWFTKKQAKPAAEFYCSIFKNSKITSISHYPQDLPDMGAGVDEIKQGDVMTVTFELDGQEFMALDGGPLYTFEKSAISFVVNCDTQEEIDYFWDKLPSGGGKPIECGWVVDKFGVCWQVVPKFLFEVSKAGDDVKFSKMMQELWTMQKISIEGLKKAVGQ